MTVFLARPLLLLWCVSFGTTYPVVNGQNAQSLRIELDPQGVISGCCLSTFYDAISQELTSYVTTTTAQVLQLYGLTLTNLVINDFVLVNSLSCVRRERHLRAESQDNVGGSVHREAYYGSTCSSCTSNSCSAFCSGCYLCSSDRRNLEERDLQLLGVLLFGVLGVTVEILDVVVAALAEGITAYVVAWLTTGTGAGLADGCMGIPSEIQITVSLF